MKKKQISQKSRIPVTKQSHQKEVASMWKTLQAELRYLLGKPHDPQDKPWIGFAQLLCIGIIIVVCVKPLKCTDPIPFIVGWIANSLLLLLSVLRLITDYRVGSKEILIFGRYLVICFSLFSSIVFLNPYALCL